VLIEENKGKAKELTSKFVDAQTFKNVDMVKLSK